jgi:Abnormal spindle-like microcephaly-assoc'd, ASPM-SPD-2-Hydin
MHLRLDALGERTRTMKPSMLKLGLRAFAATIMMILLATAGAHADSVAVVTSLGGLGANDTIVWSQLGADATSLTATPAFTSTHGLNGSVTLVGPNSLVAVVCPETLCSWNLGGLTGFATGDSLIWTADTGNSGNGPLTLNFTSKNVAGAGAFIQADGPAQFTANIQAFNGGTSLGSFPVVSDAGGDATFIGVLDSTAANITKVTFSITSCTGDCSDFALDTVSLNVPSGATPTPTLTATPTRTATATATASGSPTVSATATRTATPTPTVTATGATSTATPTATATATTTATTTATATRTATPTITPTATPTPVPAKLKIKPAHGSFGKVKIGKSKTITFTLSNSAKKGAPITFGNPSFTVPATNPQEFGFPSGATTCPQNLFPKKKCKLKVIFAPQTPGGKTSTLTIFDNATGANQTVPLSGTGQ